MAAQDLFLSGFANRAPVAAAWAWLDGQPTAATPDEVPLVEATGRILADAVAKPDRPPDSPRAAGNGYAVRAADCDGANAYNPLLLALVTAGSQVLAFGSACPVATGWTLPLGADAVLPAEAAQPAGARMLEVLAPVAPGTGIEPRRNDAGATLLHLAQRLRPQDVSWLAARGLGSVTVLRRPRVAIVVPGAKFGPDALTPLLLALLERDGALAEPSLVASADAPALAEALQSPPINACDLVLLAGRSGAGPDDTAPLAVNLAGGTLALHGIALHPGDTTGLGTLPSRRDHASAATVPIVLLPGDPLACLVAYDMLAARLVRRLAGMVAPPYPVGTFELTRKIASGIGMTEVVPVRLTGRQAQPIGTDAGLAAAVQADGFVVVPETSEGHPAGARVTVHHYNAGVAQDMMA